MASRSAKRTTEVVREQGMADAVSEGELMKRLPNREVVFRHIDKYATAAWAPALETLLVTLFLHFSLTFLGWKNDWWFVIFPMAFTRVRVFIVFHDMAHESFFPSSFANWLGSTLLGAILWCPRSFWAKGHNYHHAHSNNLKFNQFSQSSPWSLDHYKRASSFGRMMYVFFNTLHGWALVLPSVSFYILHTIKAYWYESLLSLVWLGLQYYFGGMTGLLIECGSQLTSGIIGFTLFHGQHTFRGARRFTPETWSYYENGILGSTLFVLPEWIKFFTLRIEYHHIHHLNPKVPCYRLRECHESAGSLFDVVPRVTFGEAMDFLTPKVWDEDGDRWVTVSNNSWFDDAKNTWVSEAPSQKVSIRHREGKKN